MEIVTVGPREESLDLFEWRYSDLRVKDTHIFESKANNTGLIRCRTWLGWGRKFSHQFRIAKSHLSLPLLPPSRTRFSFSNRNWRKKSPEGWVYSKRTWRLMSKLQREVLLLPEESEFSSVSFCCFLLHSLSHSWLHESFSDISKRWPKWFWRDFHVERLLSIYHLRSSPDHQLQKRRRKLQPRRSLQTKRRHQ